MSTLAAEGTLDSPLLRRLVASAAPAPAVADEPCDLCAELMTAEHDHLLDLESQQLLCACRACALLFDRRVASNGHYRLVPDRRLRLDGFVLDDGQWEDLRIPVGIAFFVRSSAEERPMAFYPGPMGATESLLELASWDRLLDANPALADLQPDVEALLVNRSQGAADHLIVPVDDCYRLVAVMRESWRGFNGGRETWQAVGAFFTDLRNRASTVPAAPRPDPISSPTGKETT